MTVKGLSSKIKFVKDALVIFVPQDKKSTIIFKSIGNPSLVAAIFRLSGDSYKPILFSKPDELVKMKLQNNDLVIVGLSSILLSSDRDDSLRFSGASGLKEIAEELYYTHGKMSGLSMAVKYRSHGNRS
jgi:hypothetical protein